MPFPIGDSLEPSISFSTLILLVGSLTCKNSHTYNLYCVGGDVKHCTIQSNLGTKPLPLTVSEIFNVKCHAMVDMTLIRPLNEDQGHSFWYQSISHIRLPIGSQY